MTDYGTHTHCGNSEKGSSSTSELNKNFEGNNLQRLEDLRMLRSNASRASTSSGSSSDISEDGDAGDDLGNQNPKKDDPKEEPDKRRFRSKSDGYKILSSSMEPFEVFPSLPDSVLEKMDLLGDGPRERLTEEELEQKFTALALAFTIDAATIKDRCERQRRYRDQTETNLHVEIDRLVEKVTLIQPLCVDAEKTEILTGLLAQVDTIMRASYHAAISAERYGAVQHEERLAESVNLMINHVTLLKQQRDFARRQLQYTKRVLQETNSSDGTIKPKSPINGKIHQRRASIHTITQTNETIKSMTDSRKFTRRTSEMSFKASISRSARPSRLELTPELDKIKEGIVENGPVTVEDGQPPDVEETKTNKEELHVVPNLEVNQTNELDIDPASLPFGQRIMYCCKKVGNSLRKTYDNWSENGILHEIFCFSALMCFSLSIITFGNILIEIEYAKRGLTPKHSFWQLGTFWSDLLLPFSKKEYGDGSIST